MLPTRQLEGGQDILTLRPELMARTIAANALAALRVSQAFVPQLLKGAAGIVWLVADAQEAKTGLLWRDRAVIP